MITGFLCVSQVPQLLLTFGGWGSRLVVYAAFLLYKSDQIDEKEMSKNKEEKHSFPPFFSHQHWHLNRPEAICMLPNWAYFGHHASSKLRG